MIRIVFLFSLFLSNVAYAQPSVVPLEHEGRRGMWFELEHARELNAIVAAQPAIRRQIGILEADRDLSRRLEAELRAALSASQAQVRLAARARRRVRIRAGLLGAVALTAGAIVGGVASGLTR